MLAGVALFLTACSGPDGTVEIYDPYEADNREVHEVNRAIDNAFVRPVSNTYGSVVPSPVRTGISNFVSNLSLPGVVVNDLLQLRIEDALNNSGRFLFNSTIGIGGILDPSTAIGIYERKSDFGETMARWGLREGAYMELPLLGPSTERDAIGKVVDFALNPTRVLLPSDLRTANTVATIAAGANSRYRFSDTIDSILYDSADSYAQARLYYLQNRRFQLGQGTTEDADYEDLYEDPYAE